MGKLIWTGEDSMKKKLFRGNLFLLLILVMLLSASCGKNKYTTMKLIKTDGEVGVENEKGKSVDLIENLGLYNGYGIGTQKKSFAWIDLDDTKLTKMDEKSDVDIKKDGKKLELVVNSGGLFFNVTKPLEDDESMDIRTSTTICGIRGTCGWVESQGDTSYVGLFDGKVECFVTVDGKEETVKVNAKEILIVKKDGDNVTYEVKELTYKDVPEFVQVEIEDEPFALEDETHTVDDFLGVYSSTENEYGDVSEAELGLDDEGALYFRQGNGIYQSYSSYEVDGNIITATYQDVTGTYTDTFTLNEDGSLTTEFGDEDLRHLNMTFAFEREISEQEEQAEASDEINRFLGTYTKDLGSYKEALILTVQEDGLLYWNAGNSYHGGWMGDRYTEYSNNGDELKATNEGGTDTFILDADGSITATFSALDFYNGVYERNDGYDETEEYPGGYP